MRIINFLKANHRLIFVMMLSCVFYLMLLSTIMFFSFETSIDLRLKSTGSKLSAMSVGNNVTLFVEEPQRAGYEFLGWYTQEEGGELVKNFEKCQKVYAQWKLATFELLYVNLEGATVTGETPRYFTIESPTITLPILSKSGYRFDGFFDEDGTLVTCIPKGSINDRVLYARWTQVETFDIRFVFNDCTTRSILYENLENGQKLDFPIITRDGFDFVAWQDGSNTVYYHNWTTINSSKTFFAIWKEK